MFLIEQLTSFSSQILNPSRTTTGRHVGVAVKRTIFGKVPPSASPAARLYATSSDKKDENCRSFQGVQILKQCSLLFVGQSLILDCFLKFKCQPNMDNLVSFQWVCLWEHHSICHLRNQLRQTWHKVQHLLVLVSLVFVAVNDLPLYVRRTGIDDCSTFKWDNYDLNCRTTNHILFDGMIIAWIWEFGWKWRRQKLRMVPVLTTQGNPSVRKN